MNTTNLLTPILTGGIQNTNYFNGRLLSAEDLSTDQQAGRAQRQQLGQAIGAGVVQGLMVTQSAGSAAGSGGNTVTVTAGLALNRLGDALALPTDTAVMLTPAPATPSTSPDAGLFSTCTPPSNAVTFTGSGVYILTLSPASGYAGSAPVSGLGNNSATSPGCLSKYAVEGVQFRLINLDVTSLTAISAATQAQVASLMTQTNAASLSMLRNLLAHLCFGTEELIGFVTDPFRRAQGVSPYLTYGALDALRAQGGLTDCDVPLCLLYWTTAGLQFIDMWAARRRAIPSPLSALWPLPVSVRRQAEAEAILQQFQQQVEDLLGALTASALQTVTAAAYFRYLPPAGVFPVLGNNPGLAFNSLQIFANRPVRLPPVYIEGASFEALLRQSLAYPPLDLNINEMVWLYMVRENMEFIAENTANPPLPYLVFARGDIPFDPYGDAHYDVSRWNYSNYV